MDAPRRLTADELREPDAVIECAEAEFYRLPQRVQSLIRDYHCGFERRGPNIRITLAAYRWREIEGELTAGNPAGERT